MDKSCRPNRGLRHKGCFVPAEIAQMSGGTSRRLGHGHLFGLIGLGGVLDGRKPVKHHSAAADYVSPANDLGLLTKLVGAKIQMSLLIQAFLFVFH